MTQFAPAPDGARIAWYEAGDGVPLLLISGQSLDHTAWDAIVPAFSERFRVVSFDHRGVGRSEAGVDESYSTRSFARDAVAVLDAAGIERAHIYGHSMGGRVAQWLAIDHPERVASAILGATSAGDERGEQRSREADADLSSGDPDRLARLFFRAGVRHPGGAAFFDRTAPPHVKRLHYQASRAHDTWDELGRIIAPTLILHGADDEMTPVGNARLMAGRIPGARLQVLDGARHGYYLDDVRATGLVQDFLDEHAI